VKKLGQFLRVFIGYGTPILFKVRDAALEHANSIRQSLLSHPLPLTRQRF
jgi:hypothetical protein